MKRNGFTLIELMIVVAIIGILASIASPAYQDYTIRAQVIEAMSLTSTMKGSIDEYYRNRGEFPADNEAAGTPLPEQMIGNYVNQITVEGGAMHVRFGNHANSRVADEILSIRPLIVPGSPLPPLSWNCGYGTAPTGMEPVGENRSTVEPKYLPSACR